MCDIADALRWQLYIVSSQFKFKHGGVSVVSTPPQWVLELITKEREGESYQGTLQRLREHCAEHGCQREASDEWMEIDENGS